MINQQEWDVVITVLGEPNAQKRHKSATRDRKGDPLPFVRSYDPSKSNKRDLKRLVQAEAPEKPFTGPLRVDCYFYFAYRKGDYGTGRNKGVIKTSAPKWKDTGKDRDNCDKLILDALTGIFWLNDSQICDGRIKKLYSEKPRTEIFIKRLCPER